MANNEMKEKYHAALLKLISTKSRNAVYLPPQKYTDLFETVKNLKSDPSIKKSPLDCFKLNRYDIKVIKGVTVLTNKVNKGSPLKFYVSTTETFDIIHKAHLAMGHAKKQKLMTNLHKKYRNITGESIQLYINMCKKCSTPSKVLLNDPKQNQPDTTMPLCQVDLIDMTSKPDGEFRFILVLQDDLTSYVQLRPLKTCEAEEITNVLLEIFTIFGAPSLLSAPRLPNAVIKRMEALWNEISIVKKSKVAIPTRTIKDAMTQPLLRPTPTYRWSEYLKLFQMKMNGKYLKEITSSPHEAVFGTRLNTGFNNKSCLSRGVLDLEGEGVTMKSKDLGNADEPDGKLNNDSQSCHGPGEVEPEVAVEVSEDKMTKTSENCLLNEEEPTEASPRRRTRFIPKKLFDTEVVHSDLKITPKKINDLIAKTLKTREESLVKPSSRLLEDEENEENEENEEFSSDLESDHKKVSGMTEKNPDQKIVNKPAETQLEENIENSEKSNGDLSDVSNEENFTMDFTGNEYQSDDDDDDEISSLLKNNLNELIISLGVPKKKTDIALKRKNEEKAQPAEKVDEDEEVIKKSKKLFNSADEEIIALPSDPIPKSRSGSKRKMSQSKIKRIIKKKAETVDQDEAKEVKHDQSGKKLKITKDNDQIMKTEMALTNNVEDRWTLSEMSDSRRKSSKENKNGFKNVDKILNFDLTPNNNGNTNEISKFIATKASVEKKVKRLKNYFCWSYTDEIKATRTNKFSLTNFAPSSNGEKKRRRTVEED